MDPAAGPAASIGMPPISVSSGPAIAEGQASSTGTSTTGAFNFGSPQAETPRGLWVALILIGGLILWRTR